MIRARDRIPDMKMTGNLVVTRFIELGAEIAKLPADWYCVLIPEGEELRIRIQFCDTDGAKLIKDAYLTWEAIEDAVPNPLMLAFEAALKEMKEKIRKKRTVEAFQKPERS
jgi:hypothetical protein